MYHFWQWLENDSLIWHFNNIWQLSWIPLRIFDCFQLGKWHPIIRQNSTAHICRYTPWWMMVEIIVSKYVWKWNDKIGGNVSLISFLISQNNSNGIFHLNSENHPEKSWFNLESWIFLNNAYECSTYF